MIDEGLFAVMMCSFGSSIAKAFMGGLEDWSADREPLTGLYRMMF